MKGCAPGTEEGHARPLADTAEGWVGRAGSSEAGYMQTCGERRRRPKRHESTNAMRSCLSPSHSRQSLLNLGGQGAEAAWEAILEHSISVGVVRQMRGSESVRNNSEGERGRG